MTRPLVPLDLLDLQSVGDVAVHPDGELVAYTVTQADKETDSYRSQIHFHRAGLSTQVSYGHNDALLRFSPSGCHLAYVSRTDGGQVSVAVLNVADRSLHSVQGVGGNKSGPTSPDVLGNEGITDIQWLDEDHLVILSRQASADTVGVQASELGRRPQVMSGVGGLNEGPGWVTDRLATIDVVEISTGIHRRLGSEMGAELGTEENSNAQQLDYAAIAVSPDGSQVLASATRGEDGYLLGHHEILVMPSAGGPATVLASGGNWSAPGWTADGRSFASTERNPLALGLSRLTYLDTATAPAAGERVCDEPVRFSHPGSASAGRWSTPDALYALAHRRGTITVDRITLGSGTDSQTQATTIFGGGVAVSAFDLAPATGRIVAAVSSPTRPAELWEVVDGEQRKLVSLNDELLNEIELAPVEVVQVPSTDGAVVEAFVFRPTAGSESSHPGLVYIHGGPTGAYGMGFFDEFQIAAAAGYVVIAGNPRGSDGYGDDWAESITGRIGTIDFDDITALSDYLEALPEVEETRIGIGGGSYGGLMTAWMIGHTERYQAALVERCVSNLESFAGTSDIGGFFTQLLNGTTVAQDHAELRRQSPLSYAPNTTCPVLVIHSDSDWRCPLEQGQQIFAAYRRAGVDASMVIFPGENHELSRSGSPRHRTERFGFVHDFYAKHLGGVSFDTTWPTKD